MAREGSGRDAQPTFEQKEVNDFTDPTAIIFILEERPCAAAHHHE
ncbi:MAG: hypothetical protein Fur0021_40490 [Candidatus Promineifilaceae bacterium]